MTGQGGAGKLICPRCKHVWWVEPGTDEVECNCHRYCDDGFQPSDCNLISQTPPSGDSLPHDAKYPYGIHNFSPNYGDDVLHRTNYCTVHGKYTYKVPIIIPFDWEQFSNTRAPMKLRQVYQSTGI